MPSGGPISTCWPVSSSISRRAAISTCSCEVSLPLGRDQSSYRGRCTNRISRPSGPSRHTTPPAAITVAGLLTISTLGNGVRLPASPTRGDQAFLQIAQWFAVRVSEPGLPGVIGLEPPGPRPLVETEVEQVAQLSDMVLLLQLNQYLD